MLTLLFPGQGSQVRGMGSNLFDEFPDLVKQANNELGYSIRELCLNDPDQQLNQTQYTQPALYIVNAFSYLKKLKDNHTKPDYVIGHSLGEYNALLTAEVFDFMTGLKLVKKRGELMSLVKHGKMAAIIGLKLDKVTETLLDNNLDKINIANYNSYTQFVISGAADDIDKAAAIFKKMNGINFITLRVSGAFHSSYMTDVKNQFSTFLENFEFGIPRIPVISNFSAELYHPLSVKVNLANQINHPVQWVNVIENLSKHSGMIFEEMGPGNVLTNLLKRIQNDQ